jgi:hypothetical protein
MDTDIFANCVYTPVGCMRGLGSERVGTSPEASSPPRCSAQLGSTLAMSPSLLLATGAE